MSKLIVNEITKYDASQVTFTDNTNVVITGSLSTAGASVTGTLAVTGNLTVDTNTLFVDAANNLVGIGTLSPASFNQRVNAPHLVVGNGSNSAGVTIYSGSTAQGSINFADGTTTTEQYTGGIVYVHGADNYMSFHTNGGVERMRIHSSGDISFKDSSANEAFYWDASAASLGIGGASDSGYKLDVSGRIKAENTAYIADFVSTLSNASKLQIYADDSNVSLVQGGTSVVPMTFFIGGSERMRIDASGNVGIGIGSINNTASGRTVLDINGTTTSWINQSVGGSTISYIGANSTNAFWNTDGAYFLAIGTNNTERMRIDSSGNVGIGTSPAAKLEVKGDTSGFRVITTNATSVTLSMLADLGLGYDNAAQIVAGQQSSNNGYLAFNTKTAGVGSEKMRIDASGNVGIGGTPSAKLEVFGKTIVGSNSSNALEIHSNGDTEIAFSYSTKGNNYAKIIGDITNASPLGGEIAFQTASGGTLAERMRILSSGGITFNGDTSTANALDDYEEGTFTPTFATTSGGFASITYNVQYGKYTKIGNRVDINIQISCSTVSLGTAGGVLVVAGLPFTVGAKVCPVSLVFVATWPTNRYPIRATTNDGATNILLRYVTALNENETYLNGTDIQAGSEITISGTYFI